MRYELRKAFEKLDAEPRESGDQGKGDRRTPTHHLEDTVIQLNSSFRLLLVAMSRDGVSITMELGDISDFLDIDLIPSLRKAFRDLRQEGWSFCRGDVKVAETFLRNFIDGLWNLPARVDEWRKERGKELPEGYWEECRKKIEAAKRRLKRHGIDLDDPGTWDREG